MALSRLLLRRLNFSTPLSFRLLSQFPNSLHFSSLAPAPDSTPQSPSSAKPTSLSARMSFIFDQIDEIDKDREERDSTLQRIRAWRESKKQNDAPIAEAASEPPVDDSTTEGLKVELEKSEAFLERSDGKKEVELVHPWPEWIELMERLLQQNYFDHRRKYEDGMMQGLGFDLSESAVGEDKRPDFARDFRTVQAALVNFGRDRFDILRALSRNDLQLLVGYGCPSTDKKVAYSGKLLRKHVHLDEGDVCSSCSLRSSCEKAYLLTNKEDEARTIDVMRILLAYGFNPIDGSLSNKSLLKMKPVKTVVRKLLHEVVKLSAVPIDPKLHPPVIKRPPPKVKQPPPPPKKRVGRDDVEMKKGDWLCPKCEFMNFAKNTVCLQCDAKRPKRQLLPGEWECPQCNFLNYRRNTVCFHCEHNRPPDTYAENQFPEKQRGSHIRMDKKPARADVSNAWNFDFDDHESDGADVATFEYADSRKLDEDFPLSQQILRESSRGHANDPERSRSPRGFEAEHSDSTSRRHGLGFNDFDEDDDDDVDSYELVSQNEEPKTSRVDFSELEADSESEDLESNESNWSQTHGRKQNRRSFSNSKDNVDFDTDDDLPIHPNWKSSHVADVKQQNRNKNSRTYGLDDEFGFSSGSEDENTRSINRGNRRAANRMDYTRGGRSKFNGSFSETDSDDHHMSYKNERQRDKQGHIRPGENRQDMNKMSYRRGGKSNFKESLYERDSDDDDSYKRESQRGRRDVRGQTRGRGGMMAEKKGSQDGGFNRSSGPKIFNRQGMNKMSYRRGGKSNFKESLYERDSDDDDSYKRESQRDRRDVRGQTRGHGGMVAEKKGSRGSDFNRSSGPKSFNRSNGKGSYGRNARDGNSSKFQGNRQGDRFDGRADSYEDEARQRRPRMNVR